MSYSCLSHGAASNVVHDDVRSLKACRCLTEQGWTFANPPQKEEH
jgi:hypothetical protein